MIKRIINAIKARDYEAVTQCFEDSEKVCYIDYCPINVGYDNFFIYGSRAVEMFFRDKFFNGSFCIEQERIEDENSATFFGCYNNKYYFGRLTVEELGENGLIKKAVVRPE
ncbi:MAG: hypothetical protein IJ072_08385 [Oscillospiraceae bacterium]|nr:hypothetical protein [Oscillospiraceae bacterium]